RWRHWMLLRTELLRIHARDRERQDGILQAGLETEELPPKEFRRNDHPICPFASHPAEQAHHAKIQGFFGNGHEIVPMKPHNVFRRPTTPEEKRYKTVGGVADIYDVKFLGVYSKKGLIEL